MKKMYGRFQQKHDTEANWLLATNFAPLEGEVIIYDPDENYDYPRIKIGIWDGTSEKTNGMLVSNLPFVNDISFDILTNGSIGLKYALYDDHAEFIGLGECTDAWVEIASMVQGLYVTAISDNALHGCSGLTSITIPDGVTSIGASAFSDCYGLTSITIGSSVTSIGNDAFLNCSGLTSITIPDSVTSIGNGAFYYCYGLTSITIPDGVTSIGDSAFSECSGLTSVTIGNSVTSIGDGVFQGCANLTDVYYTGTEEQWNAITIGANNTYLTNATIHYNWEG